MEITLKDKIALVTGGSKGIGAAAAASLSATGARVAICARNFDELKLTAASIEQETGNKVFAVKADITSQQDIDKVIRDVERVFGPINILVNNAGRTGTIGPFEDIDADEYLSVYDLNVVSMVRFIKAVLPGMKERRWGRIINLSSENGLQPDPDMTPYNLTKAAIINLSKSLSKSVGEFNILVNTVSPAFIETPLVENMLAEIASQKNISVEEASQYFLSQKRPNIVLGRTGKIEEVGAAVAFLASDHASFITGTNLRVDGGSVASI